MMSLADALKHLNNPEHYTRRSLILAAQRLWHEHQLRGRQARELAMIAIKRTAKDSGGSARPEAGR